MRCRVFLAARHMFSSAIQQSLAIDMGKGVCVM